VEKTKKKKQKKKVKQKIKKSNQKSTKSRMSFFRVLYPSGNVLLFIARECSDKKNRPISSQENVNKKYQSVPKINTRA